MVGGEKNGSSGSSSSVGASLSRGSKSTQALNGSWADGYLSPTGLGIGCNSPSEHFIFAARLNELDQDLFSLAPLVHGIHACPPFTMDTDGLSTAPLARKTENTASTTPDQDHGQHKQQQSSPKRKLEENDGPRDSGRPGKKRDMGRNEYL